MAPGDVFLMRTGQPERVEYEQHIDCVVGEEAPEDLRRALSNEIWASEEYDLLWFSASPMRELDLPQAEFVDLVREQRPDFKFKQWFPSMGMNFTRLSDDFLADFGGEQAFLDRLEEGGVTERLPGTDNHFALDATDNLLDVRETHQIDFQQTATENISDLIEAENDGRVLLYDQEGFFAMGRIGNIEGKRRENGIHKIVNILDWEEFPHVPHRDIGHDLSIEFNDAIANGSGSSKESDPPYAASIISLTEEDINTVLGEAGKEGVNSADLDDLSIRYMAPDDQWDVCIEQGVILIGWPGVSDLDLSDVSLDVLEDRLGDEYPNAPAALLRFRDKLPRGTLLVAKDGPTKMFGIGVVTGQYRRAELPGADEENVHVRDVDWILDFHDLLGHSLEISDWEENDLPTTTPFDITTGVRELKVAAYREIRRQAVEADPSVESSVERAELIAQGLSQRYSPDFSPSYFWVNQSDSAEIEGQFLSAPDPANSWQQDLSRLSIGDIIIHHQSKDDIVIGLSTVLADPSPEEEKSSRSRVPVYLERFADAKPVEPIFEYLSAPDFYEETDHYLFDRDQSRMVGYLFNLPSEPAQRIIELPSEALQGTDRRYADYTDELAVPEDAITVEPGGLYFEEDQWEALAARIEQALANGNHILLFGPPGTGKTKLARTVCEHTVGEDGYELVTASADWSTFDTIGGYRTTGSGTLEFHPGVFLNRFRRDEDGTPDNEWLVIDEINRADIDKAFGSLFSALTGESVTLPYDGPNGQPVELLASARADEHVQPNRYYIPEDWRMIATMNTLDKTSLYEMSYAFMRRWAFIPIGTPDFDQEGYDDEQLATLVGRYVSVWTAGSSDLPETPEHFEPVGRIWRAVGRERALGPAIVEDIYAYVAGTSLENADYVSPIIMHVFPQLEGLRTPQLEQVIRALDDIVSDVGHADQTTELWRVARDFFQVDLQSSREE